eukprot:Opistho-2@10194
MAHRVDLFGAAELKPVVRRCNSEGEDDNALLLTPGIYIANGLSIRRQNARRRSRRAGILIGLAAMAVALFVGGYVVGFTLGPLGSSPKSSPSGAAQSAPQGIKFADAYIPVVPLPAAFTRGNATLAVTSAPAFRFEFPAVAPSRILIAAAERYNGIIFDHTSSQMPHAKDGALNSLVVECADLSDAQTLETDESYSLDIPADGSPAKLTATTVFGVLRGLETFSQLVHYNYESAQYEIVGAPWSIQDAPRFKYRGLLIDTSRHFLPIRHIFNLVDALSFAKFNVLHWHIIDDPSFPVETPSRPKLWAGAYSAYERYTIDDVRAVVEYARMRGVMVMPEVDFPGHTRGFCAGYPELCTHSTLSACQQWNTPGLDPSVPGSFEALEAVVDDFVGGANSTFNFEYLHLGGDEVGLDCWNQEPHIAAWLKTMNFTDASDAYLYSVLLAQKAALKNGVTPVHWEEVFLHFGDTGKLDPSTIIHVWLDHNTLAKVVAAGYHGILSDSQHWYLDALDVTWQKMYANEPLDEISDPAQQALVVGGEACMWGETVDAGDLMATTWPRAAAVAERLWSPREVTDVDAAAPRMSTFRCIMNKRGYVAAPSVDAHARDAPPGPGGCYVQ